ncbi:threonyl-tRNA synthetase [Cenococcum geophilum 1.58]|uniref:Threonyl-tRNA synthetase n=1 Tax=Cenococcum geophilum 1.58 TaxID=794803 RepID=A0ACC8EK46_9PEZI|nr:threonyl-tRNA synthetase [Cenococcum geophilum 1.58]
MRPFHFHIKPSTPYRCFPNSLRASYAYMHPRSSQQALSAPSNVESPASSAAVASNGPDFVQHRLSLFDRLLAEQKKISASKPREEIRIRLPQDRFVAGNAWETTPASIARTISKSLYEQTIIAEVDGELWDLDRKKVFWHSAAHVLGEAAETRFSCLLCNGPPTEDPPGFYYDMVIPDGKMVQSEDQEAVEKLASTIIKEKQPFERLEMTKTDILEMFKYSKFKVHFINERVPDGSTSTVYRCGSLIDFCRGPHVRHTGITKAFSVLRNSSAYWLGDSNNESVQRIAGIAFPNNKLLQEYKTFLTEAAKRNHRKIGTDQKLFFFDEVSPGSCFFLPHGARIYNALLDFLKSAYFERGYDEVITPNIYKSDLWKTSGHWDHYEQNMFTFEVEKEKYGLKPMNCPGHCKIFSLSEVSYRNLPWRMADFGVLHRNEYSGALSGLTRVRRFAQDDAHIFCALEQAKLQKVEDEIRGILDFLHSVYGLFGFTYKLRLSTRPEKYLGRIETWNDAEAKLKAALNTFTQSLGTTWSENPGDGAFYGPKIDVALTDALKREHQCGTIQLDFQLPQRFRLRYATAKGSSDSVAPASEDLPEGYARPVMIHRAIFGSFERMIAILTEHLAGKWPFWLSPRQILVVPVMPAANDYAVEVQNIFKKQRMYVDVDLSGNTFQKKIRTGQLEQYNFIFVVGAQERDSRTVNIRNRDDVSTQSKGDLVPLQTAIDGLKALRDERRLVNKL